MTLQPVPDQLGLWKDDAQPSGAGVYALIIGVSAYPHLQGGAAPAADTFGMRQLVSSAATAGDVFVWLRSEFRHADLQPKWCQLLLSPTDAERKALTAAGITHYAAPTVANIRDAVKRWTARVPKTEPDAPRSRSFFFFSGHGFQTAWHPVLLPADYLNPEYGEDLRECLGTKELKDWMESHPAAEHIAIFDACRNDVGRHVAPHTMFPQNEPGGAPPRVVARYTSTGANAVSYVAPDSKQTFFGQALLEALTSPGKDVELDFNDLIALVKPRVTALVHARNNRLIQDPVPVMEPMDAKLVVTRVPVLESVGGLESFNGLESMPPRKDVFADVAKEQAAADRALAPLPKEEWESELPELRLISLADGTSKVDFAVADLQRDARDTTLRLDLHIAAHAGGVLAVFDQDDEAGRNRIAIPLPTDGQGPVPIRMTLLCAGPEGRRLLEQIEVGLGPPRDGNDNYEYLWKLWSVARARTLRQAAASADPGRLRSAVAGKLQNPTAAFAGAILLAHAGRISVVDDWTRNLMQWFPTYPDGAVLWAKSLKSAIADDVPKPYGVDDPLGEMADALQQLDTRGLPFFAGAIELADGLVRFLRRREADLSTERRAGLLRVEEAIERAYGVARPSGHFFTVSGRRVNAEGAVEILSVETLLGLVRPGLKGAGG